MGTFVTRKAWPRFAILRPGESCALHNTEPPGSSSRPYASTQDIPAAGSARAWLPRCPSTARAAPGSLQTSGPGRGCSGGSCPVFLWPQWQQCLEMNRGITVPRRPACRLINIFSPKPLTNPRRTLIIPISQEEAMGALRGPVAPLLRWLGDCPASGPCSLSPHCSDAAAATPAPASPTPPEGHPGSESEKPTGIHDTVA